MGATQSIPKINFEDMQMVIKQRESHLLIQTLPDNEQQCLILNSVLAAQEEQIINHHLQAGSKSAVKIVIYGRNANDDTIYKKYSQLIKLGFHQVYVYPGGLFEWLLLQDIYGADEFMTTTRHVDILKYKPRQMMNVGLLCS